MKSLFIGFSFALTADAAPGRCNERLARAVRDDLLSLPPGDLPHVGLQWEIFDALEDLGKPSFNVTERVSLQLVAAPPRFQPSDVRDASAFVAMLRSPQCPAQGTLADRLGDALSLTSVTMPEPPTICRALNEFIEDRHAFRPFCGLVDVLDLDRTVQRPELGPLGIEKRRLPEMSRYPSGLRRFQALRVNRQILETLVPSEILARGLYMNVKQVADHVLSTIDVSNVRSVRVYGHPEHREWCRKKTIEAMQ